MYAHKLSTYQNDAHSSVVYCIVCGHETNLSAPCPGEYQLSAKETAYIDREFNEGLKKIFTSKPNPHLSHYKKLADRLKAT